MATIKAFTSIEQSKKLAKILPLGSADMFYTSLNSEYPWIWIDKHLMEVEDIPCWSLAALLEQLKAEIQLENKQILFLRINKYNDINYDIRYTNSWTGEVLIAKADNLVDACVSMIEKLNELNCCDYEKLYRFRAK